jgi:hypothetical protein
VESFLQQWYASVRDQTDQDYQLWIGLDAIAVDTVKDAMGADPNAIWVSGASGDTPAQVRQRALGPISEACDGVVLVDSDDILHPSRVAAARVALRTGDLAGCALRLVDQHGCDLGLRMQLPPQAGPEDVLPRNNVFGLSNSAFRSDLLRRCLPIPADAVLVDWFLATRAWLFGAKLTFDSAVRMDYRQHGANTARAMSPYSAEQVVQDTDRVRHHFQILRASAMASVVAARFISVERVATDVETFYEQVVRQPIRLEQYVHALNNLELPPLWWTSVAHPLLKQMWGPTGR